MKLFTLLSSFTCLFVSASFAQSGFQKTIGSTGLDRANAIEPVAGGGYILAGETQSFGLEEKDAYLVKTDAGGNVQWSLTVGGKEKENLNDVKATPDGGFIAVGEKYQLGGKGELGVLLKTDKDGNLEWKKIFDCRGNEAEGFSIQVTRDKGYVIAGVMKSAVMVSNVFFPMSTEKEHLYVMKTDAAGNELWSGYIQSDEGAWGSKGRYIIEASDGYVIAGHVFETKNKGRSKVCLLKLDLSGNRQWMRTLETDQEGQNEETASAVMLTGDNGLLISGTTGNRGAGQADFFLAKISSSGKAEWYKTYGGAGADFGQALEKVRGGYVMTGNTNSFGAGVNDVYLVGTDEKGNLSWSRTFGSTRYDISFDVTADAQGITICAFTLGFGTGGDIYFIRTGPNGEGSGCYEATAATVVKRHSVRLAETSGFQWKRLEPKSGDSSISEKDITPEAENHPQTQGQNICGGK